MKVRTHTNKNTNTICYYCCY